MTDNDNDTDANVTERGHRVLELVCAVVGHRYELEDLDGVEKTWTDKCCICGRSRTREYDRVIIDGRYVDTDVDQEDYE